jgi:hypothetical protein
MAMQLNGVKLDLLPSVLKALIVTYFSQHYYPLFFGPFAFHLATLLRLLTTSLALIVLILALKTSQLASYYPLFNPLYRLLLRERVWTLIFKCAFCTVLTEISARMN